MSSGVARRGRRRRIGAWLALGVLLACGPASHAPRSGTVVQVLDGDSLRVDPPGVGPRLEIRLHGIDAPEKGQPFADRSRGALAGLVLGKSVELQVLDVDRYGRRVCRVRREDGVVVNEEMVRLGLAWWSKKYAPDDERLRRFQDAARASRVGLWSQPEPLPPWAYRAQHRR